ncbi:leucine-rich repeat protein [uncultured Bacteroides sp.]|uniref:leucine-rich repeat protein n=1 Tax=uncultured Bacteroides sp. TaxID=162156 RepID=UPI0025FC0797|nr:leucine-rich repeat protein [uncultured Bacteroides sp.]
MKKLFIPFALALLMFASCGNDENENGEDNRTPGIIDMTSMTVDEVKAAIKADLEAGVKEFKLTGEFSKIGIPVEVSASGTPVGNPFFDSDVEVIDFTGVTDWPLVNVNGRVENFNYLPGSVRGLPARAFDGQKYLNGGVFHYYYPALREVKLPAEVKALGSSAFFACQTLTTVFCGGVQDVGAGALSACPLLATVELPEAIRIHETAFMASGIASLSLPQVTEIGGQAFQQCDNLTTLKLTAPGNLTLKINPGMGIPPFSGNFAKTCHLTLNVDKHYDSGTATPKAESATTWYTPDEYSDAYTWKSITFE